MAITTLNPFDLTGPHFLVLFAAALPLGFVAAWLVREAARREPTTAPTGRLPNLDAYQIAYLNGGAAHAIHAAIASLFQRDVIKVDGLDAAVEVLQPHAELNHPLKRAVKVAALGGPRTRVRSLRPLVHAEAQRLGADLRRHRLLLGDGPALRVALLGTLTALAVPAVGVIKIGVGVSRRKPVGFLIAACVVSTVVGLICFARLPRRTRLGDEVLARLKSANRSLSSSRHAVTPEGLALGVALFGVSFLEASNLGFVAGALRSPDVVTVADGGGSSCGTSGCGSSCGGGGGCGGGCGGCGGS